MRAKPSVLAIGVVSALPLLSGGIALAAPPRSTTVVLTCDRSVTQASVRISISKNLYDPADRVITLACGAGDRSERTRVEAIDSVSAWVDGSFTVGGVTLPCSISRTNTPARLTCEGTGGGISITVR